MAHGEAGDVWVCFWLLFLIPRRGWVWLVDAARELPHSAF
jgi:hypothetical protein